MAKGEIIYYMDWTEFEYEDRNLAKSITSQRDVGTSLHSSLYAALEFKKKSQTNDNKIFRRAGGPRICVLPEVNGSINTILHAEAQGQIVYGSVEEGIASIS